MPTVTEEFVYIILYPRYRDGTKEEARFDMDYYMNTHVKESQVLWKKMGLKKIEVHKLPEGEYSVMTTVTWWDYECFKAASEAEISQPLFSKDVVAHYSDVYPKQFWSHRVVM